jgi:hypothetical protein
MNETELLLTIAEISVAFAGFASLASIFGRRSSHSDACVDAGRVMNMLTVSLTVTGLALFPFVLMLLGLSTRWVWGTAGGLGIFAIIAAGPSVLRRTSLMKQYPGFSTNKSYWNYTFAALSLVALVCCVFEMPSGKSLAAYIGGLIALLVVSGSLFFSVIESLAYSTE